MDEQEEQEAQKTRQEAISREEQASSALSRQILEQWQGENPQKELRLSAGRENS